MNHLHLFTEMMMVARWQW